MAALNFETFQQYYKAGAQILDTRAAQELGAGFVPKSILIAYNKNFKDWVLTLLDPEAETLVVADAGTEKEVIERLISLGFKSVKGYLENGFSTWTQHTNLMDIIIDIDPDELLMDLPFDDNLVLVDVRKQIEFAEGHQKQAVNIPLQEMIDPARIAQFEDNDNIYLYSNEGYRSSIAASILKSHGIHNVRNIVGGLNELRRFERAEIVKDPEVLN